MRRFLALSSCCCVFFAGAAAQAQDWQAAQGMPEGVVAAVAEWPSGIAMMARCRQDVFDVMVPLVEAIDGPEVQVTYAFDDNDPTTRTWNASSDGEVVFVELPTRFVRALRASERLVMTVKDGSPPLHRYELEIDGETGPLVDVMEACGKPLVDARDTYPLMPDASVRWASAPRVSPADMPDRATRRGITGRATVSCQVQSDGRLQQCLVEGETPPGYRFGEAALKVAERGRVTVTEVDPTVGWRPIIISFTVRFGG